MAVVAASAMPCARAIASTRKSDKCVIRLSLYMHSSRVATDHGWEWQRSALWTGRLDDAPTIDDSGSDPILLIWAQDAGIGGKELADL